MGDPHVHEAEPNEPTPRRAWNSTPETSRRLIQGRGEGPPDTSRARPRGSSPALSPWTGVSEPEHDQRGDLFGRQEAKPTGCTFMVSSFPVVRPHDVSLVGPRGICRSISISYGSIAGVHRAIARVLVPIAGLRPSIAVLHASIARLRVAVAALCASIADLGTSIAGLRTSIAVLHASIAGLHASIARLRAYKAREPVR